MLVLTTRLALACVAHWIKPLYHDPRPGVVDQHVVSLAFFRPNLLFHIPFALPFHDQWLRLCLADTTQPPGALVFNTFVTGIAKTLKASCILTEQKEKSQYTNSSCESKH
jgi:hypothetical protein